jgi:hypothetical protein
MIDAKGFNRLLRQGAAGVAIAVAALLPACMNSLNPGTSGSETGNGWITGEIVDTTGLPMANVQVTLSLACYDPCRDSIPYRRDTTDASGVYEFSHIKNGNYTLQSVHLAHRTRTLRTGVWNEGNEICIPADTLRPPGSIKIFPPERVDVLFGYLYIPGTTVFAFMNNRTDPVLLDSVPSGTIEEVCYASKALQETSVITRGVSVAPGDTVIIAHTDWKCSKRLFLNTSSSGANVSGTVTEFPVVVRLSQVNFLFSEARGDGSDIRFTTMSGSPLCYEIERWDSLRQKAEIWVRVDTILGNNARQYITMYWGNPEAGDLSNGVPVFDTAQGFQAVWHLNESPVAGVYGILDRTANRNNGTPRNNLTAADYIEGNIGGSLNLDGPIGGGGDWVQFPNTASLDYQGALMVSAWFRVLDNGCGCNQGIFSKYVETSSAAHGYALSFNTAQRLMFVVGSGSILYYITSDNTITDSEWHYAAAGVSADSLYMYLDGKKQTATIKGVPIPSSGPAGIGILASNIDGNYFAGDVDEVRVRSVKPDAKRIFLEYKNQNRDNRLVVFE